MTAAADAGCAKYLCKGFSKRVFQAVVGIDGCPKGPAVQSVSQEFVGICFWKMFFFFFSEYFWNGFVVQNDCAKGLFNDSSDVLCPNGRARFVFFFARVCGVFFFFFGMVCASFF